MTRNIFYYRKRKLLHMCPVCCCKMADDDTHIICEACRKLKLTATNRRYAERKAAGVCVQCQGPLGPQSTIYCTKCHERKMELQRQYRERRMKK